MESSPRSKSFSSAVAALLLLLFAPQIGAAAEETKTKIIPLPIYATLPNEGDTFGAMPVFLQVEKETQRTRRIVAPSLSWNRNIGSTGTFRLFDYPVKEESYTFVASASTKVNWGLLFLWNRIPQEKGLWTDELYVRGQRSIFFRFFGIGPDTPDSSETSHTRVRGHFAYRRGLNLLPHFNLGAQLEAEREIIQAIGVTGLPLSREVFPDTPGMGGANVLGQSIDLRYDTRQNAEFSESGYYADFKSGVFEASGDYPAYLRHQFEAKALIPEFDRVQAGVRLYWRYVTSPGVPFQYQSSLGGAFLMRGFTEDRFTDQGAWTLELEQRIRFFQTHIYGVTADWRIDPFASIGQVYGQDGGVFSRLRATGGIGLRAWARPNVLGRVDIASAGRGLLFYVELGYPF